MGKVYQGPWAWHARRVHDKLLLAFHQSCDQGDLDSAGEILAVAVRVEERGRCRGPVRRGPEAGLIVARERLQGLQDQRVDAPPSGVVADDR